MTLDANLSLFLGKVGGKKAPHHRVVLRKHRDRRGVGSHWQGRRPSRRNDPSFKRPIRANLFPVRRREKYLGLAMSHPSRRHE
ncbi:DUF736 family protein [Mesorhizobium sp. M0833]|uniref:DUF736 family protein n=1 Tax=Mesorhizobium sp. M0833 TaxID=2957009 RepID=UPI0033356747